MCDYLDVISRLPFLRVGNYASACINLGKLGVDIIEKTALSNSRVTTSFVQHAVVFLHVGGDQEGIGREEEVDLLQGTTGDFGIYEPDDGHGDNVEAAKDQERGPAQA